MEYMLCRNRVSDFTKWKSTFDSHSGAHRDAGLELVRFWRGVDEPNNVFFMFEIASLENARQFISNAEAAAAGEDSGVVDGEYHFIENARGY